MVEVVGDLGFMIKLKLKLALLPLPRPELDVAVLVAGIEGGRAIGLDGAACYLLEVCAGVIVFLLVRGGALSRPESYDKKRYRVFPPMFNASFV